jgi:hypothetical protein
MNDAQVSLEFEGFEYEEDADKICLPSSSLIVFISEPMLWVLLRWRFGGGISDGT